MQGIWLVIPRYNTSILVAYDREAIVRIIPHDSIPDVLILEPQIFRDDRVFFEAYHLAHFTSAGMDVILSRIIQRILQKHAAGITLPNLSPPGKAS